MHAAEYAKLISDLSQTPTLAQQTRAALSAEMAKPEAAEGGYWFSTLFALECALANVAEARQMLQANPKATTAALKDGDYWLSKSARYWFARANGDPAPNVFETHTSAYIEDSNTDKR